MKHFIGIDGGGSKTQFALCDGEGRIKAQCTLSGSWYGELGVGAVCTLLQEGIDEICREAGRDGVAGVCFGMPGYGERPVEDANAAREIERALSPLPVRFENDVAAAWAGALAFQSGIIILAGTGSMAWGRDRFGVMKRCGGWPEFFSDEGSSYWLGRRTLELFSKQMDNRLPKGKLYELMRAHFALGDDIDIVAKLDEMGYSRKNIAALQLVLGKAALAGDESARRLYDEAVQELVLMITGLRSVMDLAPSSPVSYAGGLFGARELILEPFRKAIHGLGMTLVEPLLSPVEGAILFAADRFDADGFSRVKQGLLDRRDM